MHICVYNKYMYIYIYISHIWLFVAVFFPYISLTLAWQIPHPCAKLFCIRIVSLWQWNIADPNRWNHWSIAKDDKERVSHWLLRHHGNSKPKLWLCYSKRVIYRHGVMTVTAMHSVCKVWDTSITLLTKTNVINGCTWLIVCWPDILAVYDIHYALVLLCTRMIMINYIIKYIHDIL